MKKHRTLKIHRKFRTRRWDQAIVPEIRLEGNWLRQLGFNEEGRVQIEERPGQLILTVYEEKEES